MSSSKFAPCVLERMPEGSTDYEGAPVHVFNVVAANCMAPVFADNSAVIASDGQTRPYIEAVIERTDGTLELWIYCWRSPDNVAVKGYAPIGDPVLLPANTVKAIYPVLSTAEIIGDCRHAPPLVEVEADLLRNREARLAIYERYNALNKDAPNEELNPNDNERDRCLRLISRAPARNLADVCAKLRLIADDWDGIESHSINDSNLTNACDTALIYLEGLASEEAR